MDSTPRGKLPIRDRLPGYLAVFGAGLAAGAIVGVIVWLATSARLTDAVGYSYSALGAVLLLVGGIRGSGYSGGSASAGPGALDGGVGAVGEAGGRRGEPGRPARPDPMERRRRRLTVQPNPAAFWQVVAGCAYIAIGVLLTVLLGAPTD